MPKLSKRKRQLKEIHARKNDDPDAILDGDEDGEEDSVESQTTDANQAILLSQSSVQSAANTLPARSSARQSQKQQMKAVATTNQSTHSTRPSSAQSNPSLQPLDQQAAADTGERVWVQCNLCEKWRSLPSSVNPDSLPEVWTCSLNVYDPDRMTCEAPEEDYTKDEEQQDLGLKSFLKVWVKRLRNGDRAETRLGSSSASLTRNKKRRVDSEWIQCSNPSCGKWRALPRNIETANLIKRLNKRKRFGGDAQWFCAMNAWDDTTASCAAPQEPLWNCRWNLARAASEYASMTGAAAVST